MNHFIVRFSSDLVTKSQTVRARFQRILFQNLRQAFNREKIKVQIKGDWGRFHVLGNDSPYIKEVLARTFGIHSFVKVDFELSSDLDAIAFQVKDAYGEKIRGKTFAIRTKRVGSHSFSSLEANIAIAAQVNHHEEGKVNLDDPEVAIYVEILDQKAYLYTSDQIIGAKGLPRGVSGRALALFSGGFDSPLAAWFMEKRGLELDYLFFDLSQTPEARTSLLKVWKDLTSLWNIGQNPRLHIVPMVDVVTHIKEQVPKAYTQVVLKRVFCRLAETWAKTIKAQALVTGDALGQVSSQTLQNLAAVQNPIKIPILRPLIGFDKEDIMNLCRNIGTFQASSQVKELCQLSQEKPTTGISIKELDEAEKELDQELLNKALKGITTITLMESLQNQINIMDDIFLEVLDPKHIYLDSRTSEEFHRDGHPRGILVPPENQETWFLTLDKSKSYQCYCDHGLISGNLAYRMNQAGFEAYSLMGGKTWRPYGVLKASEEALQKAKALLDLGFPVGIPTETVYGLGANGFDSLAVKSIYKIKQRPAENPLILHIKPKKGLSLTELEEMGLVTLDSLTPLQKTVYQTLMDHFWPGPLTLIFPKGPKPCDQVTAGLDTVAIRMPDHPIMGALLSLLSYPLAAPSANRSQRLSPTQSSHVEKEIGDQLLLILDGGPSTLGIESTIVRVLPDGELNILRQGSLAQNVLQKIAPIQDTQKKPLIAPGMMAVHYAPSKPLGYLSEEIWKKILDQTQESQPWGVVIWTQKPEGLPDSVKCLNDQGQGIEAAKQLFESLRELDEKPGIERIFVEELPLNAQEGLWPGVLDRLTRGMKANTEHTRKMFT